LIEMITTNLEFLIWLVTSQSPRVIMEIMKIQNRIQWLVLAQTKFLSIMQILTIILATLTLCVRDKSGRRCCRPHEGRIKGLLNSLVYKIFPKVLLIWQIKHPHKWIRRHFSSCLSMNVDIRCVRLPLLSQILQPLYPLVCHVLQTRLRQLSQLPDVGLTRSPQEDFGWLLAP
jgi:hypothetical protein